MKSPESGKREICVSRRREYRCWPTGGRILRKSEMGPILVVVAHILSHQPFQVPFVQDDHVIQQVASAASHPTFSNPILPWTAKRSPHWLAAHGFRSRDYVAAY